MKTTRRTFLGGAAAASLPVTAGACVAVTAIQAEAAATAVIAENPDLLAAYARLQDAQAELRDAKDALEWIADEWRHRWPLAPEELLGPAGADRHMGHAVGEKDIIGNFILRDCATLTTRLSPQFRKIDRRDCFSIITSTEAQSWLEDFQQRKPRGRTPEALAQSQEVIERNIREYSQRVELARAYEKETARLRKAAGVEAAKRRIEDAKEEFFAACSGVSEIPAFGPEGLLIKAEAIKATGYMDGFTRSEGIVAEMARFIQQVIDMGGRVSI
ncbi:hypothetical protein JS562_04560 [Agrobacterium sp. S2]|nr:hypothetical protein [Agrobacterium sp. S2]